MSVAQGTVCYQLGQLPSTGEGRSWTESELDEAISIRVRSIALDEIGQNDIANLLSSIPDTNFERTRLDEILATPSQIEDWRVGEAIAEAYLSDHRNCLFPWPDSRDERKSGSSLPGADLVGFCTDSEGTRFSFGEVKTSAQHRNPPNSMTGRSGLKGQLKDLCNEQTIRNDLMRYLAHRASQSSWLQNFQDATKRYINNSSDVKLFGVLVRDVEPNEKDLQARVSEFAHNCPDGTEIELLAIYLPTDSIAELSDKVLAIDVGGDPL